MFPDIKPDNILLNLEANATRVVEAKLADCGELDQVIALIVSIRRLRHFPQATLVNVVMTR